MKKQCRHVYGPVSSWRLGRSLGIDPVCGGCKKICSFDCTYCQAGKTHILTKERKVFIRTSDILKEVKSLPPLKIDYITFSGRGEPTLAKNLGRLIKGVKEIKKEKIAVLTNSSLLMRKDVRKDLAKADFVLAKLDVHSEQLLKKLNRPVKLVRLKTIIKGIKDFRNTFKGRFALQIMFTAANKKYAGKIAAIARAIRPDETYINTPLRPSRTKPLPREELQKIKKHFKDLKTYMAYGDGSLNSKTVQ